MACVYILYSKSKNKFYTGSSRKNNSRTRLKSHNIGKVKSTKSGRPWILIHTKIYSTYREARKREIFLKSGAGRKWIKGRFGHYKEDNKK
ncbi:GIY-YIG nuclease family protein [Patescibacteria group bacterium]